MTRRRELLSFIRHLIECSLPAFHRDFQRTLNLGTADGLGLSSVPRKARETGGTGDVEEFG